MFLSILSTLVALLLAFGAAQELFMRGVAEGDTELLLVGLVGIAVSILIATAGIALWRRWATARKIAIVAGISSVLFHLYAALPPHRYVGMAAVLVGTVIGLVLIGASFRSGANQVEAH